MQHAGMPDNPILQQRIKARPSTWLVTARLLGYRPAAQLREGLARAIEWYAAGPRVQREPARRVA